MSLLGLNMMATIITMRAPGLTWSRLPIFVWAMFATSMLMVLAAPMLIATLLMAALDRTIDTTFFIPAGGGSSYLFENLFWFFGHPEVYILALPGFGIVLELLPVFTRKPLWGYRLAIAGMLGVTLLSFFVWQHHLFVSGINADLRPFYMLSTEIISMPTGFIFLCVMGTLWRARISFTVPMLFCLAWAFNFLIGGLSGVFLSDTPERHDDARQLLRDGPLPLHDHGRADLHLLRGDLLLGPEDARAELQRETRESALLADVRRVQLDVPAAVRARHGGHAAPRELLRTEVPHAQRLGLDLGVRARLLDAHLPVQRRLLADLRAREGRRRTRGTRSRSSGRSRRPSRSTTSSRYRCSTPTPTTTARPLPVGGPAQPAPGREAERWRSRTKRSRSACRSRRSRAASRSRPSRRTSARARCRSPRGCWRAPAMFFFLAFVFAYFYLRSLNVHDMWKPAHVKPDQGLGAAFVACVVLSAIADDRRRAAG